MRFIFLALGLVSGVSFAGEDCKRTMEKVVIANVQALTDQTVKVTKHQSGPWTEAVGENTGSSDISVETSDGRKYTYRITAQQIGTSRSCNVLSVNQLQTSSPTASNSDSLKLKKELLFTIADASETLTGDDCSVFAKLENGAMRVTFEVFGPAEAIVFESKSTDSVVKKLGGTSASPTTSYIFKRNDSKYATVEIAGYEDLSNTRFTLFDANGRQVRTCLYME
jgi:hypothetical protein